ncbi:type IV secretion system protein [Parasphingopyxis lamellibrachiae]|uniref:Type IV secretion system protein VirB6 n=1 Tax=Parasphingopyxis lamellibrachiae TaxID=680125 RepID=A0A3D9F931_9SPHN|nr:type IV secretion system protein [Parasphingopyxis lamellibrachiae]RED12672.1 type IV secretion system protein VirB6 [Parasphingopyxis lamellibrachiae]
MACTAISTGNAFLSSTLAHIDCQAQTIGSFGFSALSEPGSPMSQMLTALLVIFVAIFGLRLLLGYSTGPRDVVTAFLKIGIVLAMATSWPAYRTVVYDTVLHGPAELANMIGTASGLPGADGSFSRRLQTIDNAMLELSALGSGRLQPVRGTATGETVVEAFRPFVVDDELALGSARVAWLAGTIGSLAVVRIGAGLLLALAPVFAGLLLFAATRSLFIGWLQGLALMALGSLGITITLAVEVAILEPLLRSALSLRVAGIATPAAPTELLVLALAFGVALFAMIAILARIIFARTSVGISKLLNEPVIRRGVTAPGATGDTRSSRRETSGVSRSHLVVEGIEAALRREQGLGGDGSDVQRRISVTGDRAVNTETQVQASHSRPLGSSFGRTHRRASRASVRRDRSS